MPFFYASDISLRIAATPLGVPETCCFIYLSYSGQHVPRLAISSFVRLSSSVWFSAAVVTPRLQPSLRSLYAPLLLPTQAMDGHSAPASCDIVATSPTAVPPGQADGADPLLLVRQALGSAEYRILPGRSGN